MDKNNLLWDEDALATLKKIPAFVRPMAKKRIEKAALAQGTELITVDLMEQVRKKRMN